MMKKNMETDKVQKVSAPFVSSSPHHTFTIKTNQAKNNFVISKRGILLARKINTN